MKENNQQQPITINQFIRKILVDIAALDSERVMVSPRDLQFSLNFKADGTLSDSPTGIKAEFGLGILYRPKDIPDYPGGLNAFSEEFKFIESGEIESIFNCKSPADTEKAAFHEISGKS